MKYMTRIAHWKERSYQQGIVEIARPVKDNTIDSTRLSLSLTFQQFRFDREVGALINTSLRGFGGLSVRPTLGVETSACSHQMRIISRGHD